MTTEPLVRRTNTPSSRLPSSERPRIEGGCFWLTKGIMEKVSSCSSFFCELQPLPRGIAQCPAEPRQILPIAYLRGAIAGVEEKTDAAITPAIMAHGGNVSGELIALGSDIGSCFRCVLRIQDLGQPGNGGEAIRVGLAIADDRRGIIEPDSRDAGQNFGARCVDVDQALGELVSTYSEISGDLAKFLCSHFAFNVEVQQAGKRRTSDWGRIARPTSGCPGETSGLQDLISTFITKYLLEQRLHLSSTAIDICAPGARLPAVNSHIFKNARVQPAIAIVLG